MCGVVMFFKKSVEKENGKFYLTVPQRRLGTNEQYDLYCYRWGDMQPIMFDSVQEGEKFLKDNEGYIFLRQNGNIGSDSASINLFKIKE